MTSFRTFIGVALLIYMASFLFSETRMMATVGAITVIFCYFGYITSDDYHKGKK